MDQVTNHEITVAEQSPVHPVSQDIVTTDDPSKKKGQKSEHPLGKIISLYLHRLRDIEVSLRSFIPLAVQQREESIKDIEKDLADIRSFDPDKDPRSAVHMVKKILRVKRRIDRIKLSHVPRIIDTSLFLGMFSAFDAFTGNFLAAIYRRKPELFNVINRSVSVSEILKYNSFDQLKETILEKEIDNFRRKSYVDQFNELETTFGIKLKTFEKWPQFVERAQRRNLLTHCDGVVSEQYIQICKSEGYIFQTPITVGERLGLGVEYSLQAYELLMEVGLKLGQTLWRKVFPDEIEHADAHLIEVAYDCLQRKKWRLAEVFGEFAMMQRKFSSDVTRKISIINYAIALKFGGNPGKAGEVLSSVDWTAALNDFKLAEAVLLDRFDTASEIMKKIGKSSELVTEHSYHTWPLFNDFRASHQFLESYESIYGYPFAEELKRETEKAEAETLEEIKKQEQEGKLNSPT